MYPTYPNKWAICTCDAKILRAYGEATLSLRDSGKHQKKTGKKRSGWPLRLTPPPMKRSGICEIFWLWFLTFVFDYIWPKTNSTKKKKKIDHGKFLWGLLETLHNIHGFSCLGAVKKAIKIHQKGIFSLFTMKWNLFWVSRNHIQ